MASRLDGHASGFWSSWKDKEAGNSLLACTMVITEPNKASPRQSRATTPAPSPHTELLNCCLPISTLLADARHIALIENVITSP
jgi:hypothetical protein